MKIKLFRTTTVSTSLYFLLKGQLHFLNQYFEVVAVSGRDDYLNSVATREQIRVFPVRMHRAIRPLRDLVSLWQLYWLFRSEQPQIVHSITPKAGLLSMLAAKMAGVPIRMHTFTGLIFPTRTGVMQKLLIKMDQVLCWAATNVYPEGKGVKTDLIKYNITRKPLKVLGNGNINGIDVDYFKAELFDMQKTHVFRKDLTIDPEDYVFVFVGRIVADKGINELINAFTQLKKHYSTKIMVKLLIVGKFESETDKIQPRTDEIIRNHKDIIYSGFQSDVRQYLVASNCLVLPSYREGFPNVVLQAGAMGLPCIVTDVNGCNEIIIEGVNGTIIPPRNIQELVNAMRKMLEDVTWRNQLIRGARRQIINRYKQKDVWDATLNEYHILLKNKQLV